MTMRIFQHKYTHYLKSEKNNLSPKRTRCSKMAKKIDTIDKSGNNKELRRKELLNQLKLSQI